MRSAPLLSALLLLATAAPAAAFRADLDARTSAWLYPIVGRDGLVVSDEFLLQSHLRFRLDDMVPYDTSTDPMNEPDVVVAGSLRWFYDFGVGDASDPSNAAFVPMLDSTMLDVLSLTVEAVNLLGGALDARAGRIVHTGALGWRSDDGAQVVASYDNWVHLRLLGGIENLHGLWFSASPFAPEGVQRWDDTGTGADRYGDREDRRTLEYRPTFQASADGRIGPVGYDVGYRHTWKGGGDGTAESTLGAEIDGGYGPFSGFGSVRLDVATATVADALIEGVLAFAGGRHRVALDYEYFQPTFDLDSVFWVFASDPFHEVNATYGFPLFGPLRGRVWASVRRVQEGEATGDAEPVLGPFSDVGGGLGLDLRMSRFTTSAKWKFLRGTATSLAAFDLTGRYRFEHDWSVYGVASVWQYEDRPRADDHGVGGAGRLGASWQVIPELGLDGEFQVAGDPREGTTFAGFVWVDLGVVL